MYLLTYRLLLTSSGWFRLTAVAKSKDQRFTRPYPHKYLKGRRSDEPLWFFTEAQK